MSDTLRLMWLVNVELNKEKIVYDEVGRIRKETVVIRFKVETYEIHRNT
jgi:hypothetical protein